MSRAAAYALLLACAAWAVTAVAQVPRVGNAFRLFPGGSITSNPSEVVSGRSSVRGEHVGSSFGTNYLTTNPAVLAFVPGATYRVTFRYRVLVASPSGFGATFYSPAATSGTPGVAITGGMGSTGTASFTATLGPHADYNLSWTVFESGAIAVDDIEVVRTDGAGSVVATEGAEGPAVTRGILGFDITDAKVFDVGSADQTFAMGSATVRDLDGDSHPELIVTFTTYPDQVAGRPVVLGAAGAISTPAGRLFPAGAPMLRNTPVVTFADVDGDGRTDILFGDAGLDQPPFTGSRIAVALNNGDGTYRDVSALLPPEFDTTRSYSLAAGDIDGDGRTEIILPDGSSGARTALLRWNGAGFDAQRGWIDPALWGPPGNLSHQSYLAIHDLDLDGRQDLLVTGQNAEPNARILFRDGSGYSAANLLVLPDGPFGHMPYATQSDPTIPVTQGADVTHAVIADFDSDGKPDLFLMEEQITYYKPGVVTDQNLIDYAYIRANGGFVYGEFALQVLLNDGGRRFRDNSAASSRQLLGRRSYYGARAIDLNRDGFPDVAAIYVTKPYGSLTGWAWGTTLFLNDGTGAFQVVEGYDVLPSLATPLARSGQKELGAFFPLRVGRDLTEGLVVELVNGFLDGTSRDEGSGAALNVTRITAGATLGTGPGFTHGAASGEPGFNEFYYLRRHPDALAAVRAGQFASGLAHYAAIGKAAGYDTFARNATVRGSPEVDTLTLLVTRADVTILPVDGGYRLVDASGTHGTLTVEDVERIRFKDQVVDLGPAVVDVVEFYNASLDHYFITWRPDEVAVLDAGVAIKGWQRTGHAFRAHAERTAATSPVCRFYIPPAYGDSHFFGRGAQECDDTLRKFPHLVLEDATFMHMTLPSDGACPGGTIAVYRLFDNRPDANHRYTSDPAVRDAMVARGWLAEGDGPERVVMCAPR